MKISTALAAGIASAFCFTVANLVGYSITAGFNATQFFSAQDYLNYSVVWLGPVATIVVISFLLEVMLRSTLSIVLAIGLTVFMVWVVTSGGFGDGTIQQRAAGWDLVARFALVGGPLLAGALLYFGKESAEFQFFITLIGSAALYSFANGGGDGVRSLSDKPTCMVYAGDFQAEANVLFALENWLIVREEPGHEVHVIPRDSVERIRYLGQKDES